MRYYHPFAFNRDEINRLISSAIKDLYLGIFRHAEASQGLIGLLTLRGLDEGYEAPMLGIFIAEEASGQGFARQTLLFAEELCAQKGWKHLMLRVDARNTRAIKTYTCLGYSQLGVVNERTIIMMKEIQFR